jgi:hypothetical protein
MLKWIVAILAVAVVVLFVLLFSTRSRLANVQGQSTSFQAQVTAWAQDKDPVFDWVKTHKHDFAGSGDPTPPPGAGGVCDFGTC